MRSLEILLLIDIAPRKRSPLPMGQRKCWTRVAAAGHQIVFRIQDGNFRGRDAWRPQSEAKIRDFAAGAHLHPGITTLALTSALMRASRRTATRRERARGHPSR